MATDGAASWVLLILLNMLAAFERQVLRSMFMGIKLNENGRKRYNEELMQLFGDIDTLSFVRVSRLIWIGHVIRMDGKRKVNKVFNNNHWGILLRGRPKNRWWNCIQTYINKYKIKILDREVKKQS